jgi:hypothetical protein
VGRGGKRGSRRRGKGVGRGQRGRNNPNIVCTYECNKKEKKNKKK